MLLYLAAQPAIAAAAQVEDFANRGAGPSDTEGAIAALEEQCELLRKALTRPRRSSEAQGRRAKQRGLKAESDPPLAEMPG